MEDNNTGTEAKIEDVDLVVLSGGRSWTDLGVVDIFERRGNTSLRKAKVRLIYGTDGKVECVMVS